MANQVTYKPSHLLLAINSQIFPSPQDRPFILEANVTYGNQQSAIVLEYQGDIVRQQTDESVVWYTYQSNYQPENVADRLSVMVNSIHEENYPYMFSCCSNFEDDFDYGHRREFGLDYPEDRHFLEVFGHFMIKLNLQYGIHPPATAYPAAYLCVTLIEI